MVRLVCPIRLRQVILRKEGVYLKNQNDRKNKFSVQTFDKKRKKNSNNKNTTETITSKYQEKNS